jgi:hypothetical protein
MIELGWIVCGAIAIVVGLLALGAVVCGAIGLALLAVLLAVGLPLLIGGAVLVVLLSPLWLLLWLLWRAVVPRRSATIAA